MCAFSYYLKFYGRLVKRQIVKYVERKLHNSIYQKMGGIIHMPLWYSSIDSVGAKLIYDTLGSHLVLFRARLFFKAH